MNIITRLIGQSAQTALFATVLTFSATAWNAQAQFAITTPSGSTIQNFDALASTGTNAVWTNDLTLTPADSTLDGWSLFTFVPAAIVAYDAGNGGSGTGKFYSFGATAATERALGGVASGGAYFGSPVAGSVAGYLAFAATNGSGDVLTDVKLTLDGEQWRNGGNVSAQTMVFEYGFGATFATVPAWTAPGGLFDWTSPVTGTTAAAIDGNVAGLVTGVGGTISGLTWADGETLWLRWIERNDTGNDHGLAIDNFSMEWSAVPVPEPSSVALMLCAAGAALTRRLRSRAATMNGTSS